MARPVLVTGAAGLLGAACVERLLAEGRRVIALVRDANYLSRFYQRGLQSRCVEVRSDLTDPMRLLMQYEPSCVLHLAAQTQVLRADRDPLETYESNTRGTWRLLEACRVWGGVERILVASTDKVYGSSPPPYRESTPLRPQAPYEVSKAAADWIAASYGTHYGLPVVITRCGNLYGPGDLNEERLIPGVCRALAQGQAPELRSTGKMTREWLYVEDAVRAMLLLLSEAQSHPGEAFNIGGGEVCSVRAIVESLYSLAEVEALPVYQSEDPQGEIPHQALISDKLEGLGWSPQISLEEGLRETWRWYRSLG